MNELAELFPAEDHRFHLTLRRGDLASFFAPTSDHEAIAVERRRWLQEDPGRYSALLPGAEPLLDEFCAQLSRATDLGVRKLGGELEPDFLLLAPGSDGIFRLQGGALCFPTAWALEEKLGRTLDEIHGVVPGLNPALGGPLQQFLARIKAGPAYLRANWGLAATAELNLHPALKRPRLARPLELGLTWLRVEHQALAALPRTGGVVFAIRITLHPLRSVLAEPALRAGLHRALTTMSPELIAYKGLAPVREDLLAVTRS